MVTTLIFWGWGGLTETLREYSSKGLGIFEDCRIGLYKKYIILSDNFRNYILFISSKFGSEVIAQFQRLPIGLYLTLCGQQALCGVCTSQKSLYLNQVLPLMSFFFFFKVPLLVGSFTKGGFPSTFSQPTQILRCILYLLTIKQQFLR